MFWDSPQHFTLCSPNKMIGGSAAHLALRKEGNALFTKAKDPSLGFPTRDHYYKEALKKYSSALSAASNADEHLSTLKNVGMTSLRIAEILYQSEEREFKNNLTSLSMLNEDEDEWEDTSDDEPIRFTLNSASLTTYLFWTKECLHNMSRAIHSNRSLPPAQQKPSEWIDPLQAVIDQALDHARTVINGIPDTHTDRVQLRHMRTLCKVFDRRGMDSISPPFAPASRMYIDVAAKLLHRAVSLSESDVEHIGTRPKHHVCLALLADMEEPLGEAERFCRGLADGEQAQFDEEIEALKEDARQLAQTTQSVQAREIGDATLERATKGSEELSVEGAWVAYDHFKQAALLTRELDVENEAIAFSRMGRVWLEVFKDKARAHGNFLRSVELAQTLYPRDLSTRPWYSLAVASIESRRAELQEREQEAAVREKAPFLEQLQDEIAALDEAAKKGTEALVKHVYEKHPPKVEGAMMGSLETVVHYHTDRNLKDGKLWEVLCEEISKVRESDRPVVQVLLLESVTIPKAAQRQVRDAERMIGDRGSSYFCVV
ncbi:hypothetical protein M427DRAFT_45688 [Gonapodya prolifera JEL478]|uniref:Uncharacterized protein n=1 Tax=Gonapodya prolifera (strain JEL478) TaxID=1344416 RepID=A0A139A949_GONPJ|nr:hypothetical protein M427DRAFT_45688 [Gonapodya prolifera JEL478]|eukprot:KXS13351.1 hypothetical protein M427DRAFT_45688 [Gonapodya prolifera JEL478]